jgi:iron complex outermembrane receptor protein
VLASRDPSRIGDLLALTLAARLDDYSDFGSKTAPQWGIELRPINGLLVRGAYGKTFRAPSLNHLHASGFESDTFVLDPLFSDFVPVSVRSGSGSSDLRPETGTSKTLGIAYVHAADPNLRLALTHWRIQLAKSIQLLEAQLIVDNEALFADRVVRGPSQGGGPGSIVSIDAGYVNFGDLNVEGFDYQINFTQSTSFGNFSPSLTATQTYRYAAALMPGLAAVDGTSKAQNTNLWAPRWKGAVGFDWSHGAKSAALIGRYVGAYRDYERTAQIGDFWLLDASFQYAFGQSAAAKSLFARNLRLSIGGSNLLNRDPQYSNVASGFVGYDYAQADIRGRYLYTQVSASF